MRPYSPGGALITLASAETASEPPLPSAHRLRPGLPGYLIPFAPLAFVPQRQMQSRESLSPPAFLLISTHFTAPPRVPLSPPALESCSFGSNSPVEPGAFTTDIPTAYAPFMPSDSEQRLPPSYYRGCWHEVSRGFLLGLCQTAGLFAHRHFITHDRSLRPEGLLPPRGVASSGLRPLRMILDCSLP